MCVKGGWCAVRWRRAGCEEVFTVGILLRNVGRKRMFLKISPCKVVGALCDDISARDGPFECVGRGEFRSKRVLFKAAVCLCFKDRGSGNVRFGRCLRAGPFNIEHRGVV